MNDMHTSQFAGLLPTWLLDSPTYYALIVNREGICIFVNNAFAKNFLPTPKTIEFAYAHLLREPDAQKYLKAVHDHWGQTMPLTLKLRHNEIHGDAWISWEISTIRNHEGVPIGILQIGHDIAEVLPPNDHTKDFRKKVNVVLENMTDSFCMLNADWELVRVNASAEQLLGGAQEKLLGRVIWDILPEWVGAPAQTYLQRAMKGLNSQHFELYHPYTKRWFDVAVYPSEEGLAVFLKDMTERHWIEEKLRYSENKLRAMLDSTTDSNVLVSPQYKILCVNKIAEQNVRMYQQKNMREGDNYLKFVPEYERDEFKEIFQRCLAGEIIHIENIQTFQLHVSLWFRTVYYPAYDKAGILLGVSINSTNIDKEKQAENAIATSEHKLNAIYNSFTDVHILLDKRQRIISFNKAAESVGVRLYGHELEMGAHFAPFITKGAEDEFHENFQRALAGERVEVQRKRYFEHLDEWLWYLVRYTPVYDRDNAIVGVALNSIDITQIKEAEEKIAEQNESLQEIAWKHSHKVRRPLANILGLVQIIKEDLEQRNLSYNAQYLDLLRQVAEELDSVVHEIVQISNETTEEV